MSRVMIRSSTVYFKNVNAELMARLKADDFVYDRELMLTVYDPVAEALESAFDANGNFPTAYDPHRTYYEPAVWKQLTVEQKNEHEHLMQMHNFLFDDRGNLRMFIQRVLGDLLKGKQWDWRCDAIRLYYAHEHGKKTSDSYPATYMWK